MIKLTKDQTKRIAAHRREMILKEREKANQLYLMSNMGECPKCGGKEIEKDIRWLKCISPPFHEPDNQCGYTVKT